MAYGGWHPAIENACVLDLLRVLGKPPIRTQTIYYGSLTWSRGGEEVYSLRYQADLHDYWGRLDLTDDSGTYGISLGTTPLHFGGRRWWMHCPYTSSRALKLYRYSGMAKFAHRTAFRPLPTYASQRVSGIDRIQQRRWALRRRLHDPCTLEEPLNKPKWMRWRTFVRYQELDEMLSAQEDAALWVRFGRLGILS